MKVAPDAPTGRGANSPQVTGNVGLARRADLGGDWLWSRDPDPSLWRALTFPLQQHATCAD